MNIIRMKKPKGTPFAEIGSGDFFYIDGHLYIKIDNETAMDIKDGYLDGYACDDIVESIDRDNITITIYQ